MTAAHERAAVSLFYVFETVCLGIAVAAHSTTARRASLNVEVRALLRQWQPCPSELRSDGGRSVAQAKKKSKSERQSGKGPVTRTASWSHFVFNVKGERGRCPIVAVCHRKVWV